MKEKENMGNKEMSGADYLPLVKMMMEGIMTDLIDTCDKYSPRYYKTRGELTHCFYIEK